MGDRTWAALFDNSKIKQVVGDFDCAKELEDIFADPIASFSARRQTGGARTSELDPLTDRIAREQRSLGKPT